MAGKLHLIKLCVGAEKVEDLIAWQASAAAKGPDGRPRHVTRMWPKRAAQLLEGGALYWVFKGQILARQRICAFDEVIGEDEIRRCGIVLDPHVILTTPRRKRPFQGWRYLAHEDAPPDLGSQRDSEAPLPPELQAALAEIGVR
ncbi:MAG: DUF1489 domain-containing protein [Mangrovicoccus sp.]|nr:DUF1489 domain-containing protein [Mangrovicoccus sp.]